MSPPNRNRNELKHEKRERSEKKKNNNSRKRGKRATVRPQKSNIPPRTGRAHERSEEWGLPAKSSRRNGRLSHSGTTLGVVSTQRYGQVAHVRFLSFYIRVFFFFLGVRKARREDGPDLCISRLKNAPSHCGAMEALKVQDNNYFPENQNHPKSLLKWFENGVCVHPRAHTHACACKRPTQIQL